MSEQNDASAAAKALSKLGAKKGGRARASVLSPDERRESARRAARHRWGKVDDADSSSPSVEIIDPPAPTMPYSMLQGTLYFGDIPMECHVLNDTRRVLTQREVVRVISGGRVSGNLGRYLARVESFEANYLDGKTIQFRAPGGQIATGYMGTLLIDICDKYLEARESLKPSQERLAKVAETIIRASAKVGIEALIDEATGYEKIRKQRSLQLRLQAFIAEEMQEWARMFPEEFWYELARLEGIRYSPRSRPLRWGKYIMMFVYDAVDPDVGKELRAKNPNPHFLKNHHQWLKKFGREKVHDQIVADMALMKASNDMPDFKRKFARVFGRSPVQMAFDDIDWA